MQVLWLGAPASSAVSSGELPCRQNSEGPQAASTATVLSTMAAYDCLHTSTGCQAPSPAGRLPERGRAGCPLAAAPTLQECLPWPQASRKGQSGPMRHACLGAPNRLSAECLRPAAPPLLPPSPLQLLLMEPTARPQVTQGVRAPAQGQRSGQLLQRCQKGQQVVSAHWAPSVVPPLRYPSLRCGVKCSRLHRAQRHFSCVGPLQL